MRNVLGGSAAAVLGLVAFFVFAGWWVLIPTNIAWLDVLDRAMHTLGWFFYRDSPWAVPPGANPRLGIELANSIALVDGLPLFAIPFKLLSPWLPHPFQYWGYWWLSCFVLQSVFAYAFARELRAPRLVALLAAGFALITPAFLDRLTLHMALAGHWTILAALYLYARRVPPPAWAWPLLVALTAAIHPYLFTMIVGLWFASWLQRLWLARLHGSAIAAEPVAVAIAAAMVLWTVGFFYTGSLGTVGFGFFRLNLLGPVLTYDVWSKLVPSLPHSLYDYEGLSFLGIGIFAALALSVVSGSIVELRLLAGRRWLPLLLLACVFCLFAISNVPGLANREAMTIPIGPLQVIGDIFRSSGRFVWPLLYLVTVGSVVLAARHLPRALAATLLGCFLLAQLYDSSAGWMAFRRDITAPAATWPTPLTSPFWDRAATAGYTRLRAIPVVFKNPDYQWLEYYASTHHMDIDAIHLGRVDDAAIARLAAMEDEAIKTGAFEPRTLYVLDPLSALEISAHLASDDLLALVDGRIVFAKGGAHLVDGLGIDPQPTLADR